MLVKKYIAYMGIQEPTTKKQVAVEIAGLQYAIEVANERVASLRQALAIADLEEESSKNEPTKPESQEESGISTTDSKTEE